MGWLRSAAGPGRRPSREHAVSAGGRPGSVDRRRRRRQRRAGLQFPQRPRLQPAQRRRPGVAAVRDRGRRHHPAGPRPPRCTRPPGTASTTPPGRRRWPARRAAASRRSGRCRRRSCTPRNRWGCCRSLAIRLALRPLARVLPRGPRRLDRRRPDDRLRRVLERRRHRRRRRHGLAGTGRDQRRPRPSGPRCWRSPTRPPPAPANRSATPTRRCTRRAAARTPRTSTTSRRATTTSASRPRASAPSADMTSTTGLGTPNATPLVASLCGATIALGGVSAKQTPTGKQVSLRLHASDPRGGRLSWSAKGLPPGLKLNRSSGRITGRTRRSGHYVVRATVRDSDSGRRRRPRSPGRSRRAPHDPAGGHVGGGRRRAARALLGGRRGDRPLAGVAAGDGIRGRCSSATRRTGRRSARSSSMRSSPSSKLRVTVTYDPPHRLTFAQAGSGSVAAARGVLGAVGGRSGPDARAVHARARSGEGRVDGAAAGAGAAADRRRAAAGRARGRGQPARGRLTDAQAPSGRRSAWRRRRASGSSSAPPARSRLRPRSRP